MRGLETLAVGLFIVTVIGAVYLAAVVAVVAVAEQTGQAPWELAPLIQLYRAGAVRVDGVFWGVVIAGSVVALAVVWALASLERSLRRREKSKK